MEGHLRAVAHFSESLFPATDVQEVGRRALSTALALVGAESGSLLLADAERRELVFRCSIGAHPVPSGTRIPWERGIAGRVFHSGQPERVDDVATSPDHNAQIDTQLGHTTRQLLCVPLRRFDGAPTGVLNLLNKHSGSFTDADLALMVVLASLTTVALEQATKVEEAELAELARALGGIGHDVKNLLTPVVSSAGLLAEELELLFARPELASLGDSRELCLEAIALIRRTGDRIQHRVRDLADCVKGKSTPPVFAPCTLAPLVDDVIDTLSPLAREGGLTLIAEGLRELPELEADAHRLYSALYNLVHNAVVAGHPGGHVWIRGQASAAHLMLEIRDDGAGMTDDVRERLFTFRAISTARGGTGLGTRIVKDMVEAHGGTVSVESVLGHGSTFRLVLPRTRA